MQCVCVRRLAPVLTHNAAAWTELSPAEFGACCASIREIDLTLSKTGWFSCSYEAGRISLWIPVERRGSALARCGRRVLIGADSGAITILELPGTQS
jgi:hypothetical protein